MGSCNNPIARKVTMSHHFHPQELLPFRNLILEQPRKLTWLDHAERHYNSMLRARHVAEREIEEQLVWINLFAWVGFGE